MDRQTAKHMAKEEKDALFREKAEDMARFICGDGKCSGCFDCGHTNKSASLAPKYGIGDTCPLAGYQVTPDSRTFREKLEAGIKCPLPQDILDGTFAMCACCEHTQVIYSNNGYELNRMGKKFEEYCMDCPVQHCRESVQENMAEAAMS